MRRFLWGGWVEKYEDVPPPARAPDHVGGPRHLPRKRGRTGSALVSDPWVPFPRVRACARTLAGNDILIIEGAGTLVTFC